MKYILLCIYLTKYINYTVSCLQFVYFKFAACKYSCFVALIIYEQCDTFKFYEYKIKYEN